jgi:DnaK suppressor protein
MAATKKKVVKKAVTKKAPAKKIVAKKPAKPAPKKLVAKKVASKKPVKKVASKKPVATKTVAKKPILKKSVSKKVVVKKIMSKKASKPVKKIVKPAPKKAAAKKPVKKVVKPVAKKAPVKKVAAKKTAAKAKVPVKKITAKKPIKKVAKPAPKKVAVKKVVKKAPAPATKKAAGKKNMQSLVDAVMNSKAKAKPAKPVAKKVAKAADKKPVQKPLPAVAPKDKSEYKKVVKPSGKSFATPAASKKPTQIDSYDDVILAPKPVPIQPVSTVKITIPSYGTYETAADIAKREAEANAVVKKPKNKSKLFEQISTKTTKTEAKKKKNMKKIELPKGYKPSDKEEYMNPNQLEYFKQKLLDWKKELLSESTETLDHLKNENWNEPDPSDQATVVEQTGLELRTRDRYRKLINKIDSAVARVDDGSFGFCEVSGEPIGLARLEARPIATMTIAAQEQHEREEKMIIEEN